MNIYMPLNLVLRMYLGGRAGHTANISEYNHITSGINAGLGDRHLKYVMFKQAMCSKVNITNERTLSNRKRQDILESYLLVSK